jgi:FixJ family two-component response regulator
VIVVVDDDAEYPRYLRGLLASDGIDEAICHCDSARALRGALESEEPIEMFVLDVVLGRDWNGLRICEILRASWPDVPIVIVTGGDPYVVETALELGATDFISKGANQIEVLSRLKHALALGARQRAQAEPTSKYPVLPGH